MKATIATCLLLATLLAGGPPVQAQEFPTKPVRLVVPFPPGGIADTLARSVGQGLSAAMGQPIVIDNRPGAGGNIAATAVAKSQPDGYTLFLGLISTHAVNVSLYKTLPYDPVKDFQPIGRVAQAPLILVVHPSVPAKSVAEFVAYAKANPRKLNYASAGVGSASHLAMAMFSSMADIELVHVPFKGTGPLKTDLIAGRVEAYFDAQVSGLANIQAGQVRALGIGSSRPSPALPDVTPISATIPGFEFSTWFGLLAPAGLPADRLAKLSDALRGVLANKETQAFFAQQGLQPTPSTPDEFARFIDSETTRLRKIVKDSGAQAE